MSRNDHIVGALQALTKSSPDVEGAVLVTMDGLPLASALGGRADEDRVAAMGAAALSMGSRIVSELQRGDMEQLLVKVSGGYVILMKAGRETVLEVISTEDAKLGLLLYEMKVTARQLADYLR